MIRWLPHVLLGVFLLVGCSQIKGIFTLRDSQDSAPQQTQTQPAGQSGSSAVRSDTTAARQTQPSSGKIRDLEMQVDELNFQIKKQRAEVDYVKNQLDELQAKSEIWLNPLSVYDKEVVLNNGTTLYGKIVAQDEQSIKVETLIGYLTLTRQSIVRIVDNEAAQFQRKEERVTEGGESAPQKKKSATKRTTDSPVEEMATTAEKAPKGTARSANCVLVGGIKERSDASGNHIFTGSVKNTGERRADFVKIHFQFRQNWSGDTKSLTAFVDGARHTFKSGVTSDATLPPGGLGQFELYVTKSFGNYIGYSYSIDWEEYE
ncbi:MAG: hypothetical protein MAGBODY4_00131 [Candidatus Marinimicrobia bacterium]|nr:hypothetical protein [Candidatus Neomarinimicrobiota bacterium]